jgi:thiol-disulfide isomerase/thioredoxin
LNKNKKAEVIICRLFIGKNKNTPSITLRSILYIVFFLLVSVILYAQTPLDTAVNFTVKDVTGTTHRLYEYLEQDKIVVIDFFTITCGPCSTYAPLINESYTHFGCNTSNVVFLGTNWGADNSGVTDFGITYGVHYPEISGTEGNGNHVVADYSILSYPTVILILPDSTIAENYIWPPETNYLDSIIIAHGGNPSECYTPVRVFEKAGSLNNGILSVFPMPADDIVTCVTSFTEPGSLEICSLTGAALTGRYAVLPGENSRISTAELHPGYYLLLLRDKNGTIRDRKPLIIQK